MSNKKENFKYAISYIPLVAFFLFFTQKDVSEEYKKHIKYGMILFLIYVISSTLLRIISLWWLTGLIFLIYMVVSIFLGYKTYNGEKVDVDILNNISDTFEKK